MFAAIVFFPDRRHHDLSVSDPAWRLQIIQPSELIASSITALDVADADEPEMLIQNACEKFALAEILHRTRAAKPTRASSTTDRWRRSWSASGRMRLVAGRARSARRGADVFHRPAQRWLCG